ncbi:hypothetical protein J7K42_00635 [bacterium]|nr:hypothetical protein [bacterium]
MEIHIEYGADGRLSPEFLEMVRSISRKYGKLSETVWGQRVGAIDLVTILEIVGVFIGMKAIDGFVEGLIGKDWFTNLGRKTRNIVSVKLREFSNYLLELFNRVIASNRDRYGAVAVTEYIDDVTLYVVLNHKYMNAELISSLPFAIAKVVREIVINGLPEDNPKIVQLFPSFKANSWDYLFVPSVKGFGQRFIDRYLDLRDGQYYIIHSSQEFQARFSPHDRDIFKFLISFNKNYDMSIFKNL